ncbi:hypothetical protein ETB97_001324 [Aspergillus alliaceus]|uniref:Uncharacterized protein n=1 Tax=Petromyces alliaceus TaxID=209559 RepID=A0A8H6A4V7_PETAA|nr:hypothetical protein ETB97_001324 [Aspergillus burnettii]
MGSLPPTQPPTDILILKLYYRWALQSFLSALVHIHPRAVFVSDFIAHVLWLRSDFSIAPSRLLYDNYTWPWTAECFTDPRFFDERSGVEN